MKKNETKKREEKQNIEYLTFFKLKKNSIFMRTTFWWKPLSGD